MNRILTSLVTGAALSICSIAYGTGSQTQNPGVQCQYQKWIAKVSKCFKHDILQDGVSKDQGQQQGQQQGSVLGNQSNVYACVNNIVLQQTPCGKEGKMSIIIDGSYQARAVGFNVQSTPFQHTYSWAASEEMFRTAEPIISLDRNYNLHYSIDMSTGTPVVAVGLGNETATFEERLDELPLIRQW